MKHGNRRGVSFGTIVAILLTIIVLGGTLVLFSRLADPENPMTVGRIMEAFSSDEHWETPAPTRNMAASATAPASLLLSPVYTAQPSVQPSVQQARTLSVTFGGAVVINGDVRRSCYFSESGKYDFTELFNLISDRFTGDMTFVTLENLTDGTKYGELLAPAAVMSSLRNVGIRGVALGFAKCLDKGNGSLLNTVQTAEAAGLTVIGAYSLEERAQVSARIMNIGGVRVAVLHFTDGISSSSTRKLNNAGMGWLVTLTSQAGQQIAEARALGAEVVIVSLSWGKGSNAQPTSAMKRTAQACADAGADAVIGTGSGAVQKVTMLTSADGRSVPVAYSLGYLMTTSRTDNGVTGMLLHLTWSVDAEGKASLTDAAYTPTYIWNYKQDGDLHYRVVCSTAQAPDGMDSSQQKTMKKAAQRVADRLGSNTPLHPLE